MAHDTSIVERIEKLIAKAESTTHVEEARTFMAKAQSLMLKHSIEQARLGTSGKAQKAVVEIHIIKFDEAKLPASYWPVLRDAAASVGYATGVVGVAYVNSRRLVYIYGTKTDAEQVGAMISSMWRQSKAHLNMWRKIDPRYNSLSWGVERQYNEKWACTIAFLKGFGHGFADSIREAKDAVVAETGSALVLVGRSAEIKAAMSDVRTVAARPLKTGSYGYMDGRRAGYDAQKGNRLES